MKAEPPWLKLFRRLTSVPTAPYFEGAVTAEALAWTRENLGSKVRVRRHRGGLAIEYRGLGKGPALAFAAHLDHPAFRLASVSARGAKALLMGGLPRHLLAGCAVEAFPARPKGNVPLGVGVLGAEGPEGVFPIKWTRPPAPGSKPAFAVLALPPCSVKGGWLLSRSIDDLLGCAVSLEALRRLASARAATNATVLLHRAEEVGFMGALDLIRHGQVDLGDSVISVESSRELPGARPGQGPVIRLGDKATLFDPNLAGLLEASAAGLQKRGRRFQRLRLTGGTCEATAYLAFGYEASGLAVPLVNYHNGWGAAKIAPEKVRLEDAEGAADLLAEAARLFPSWTLRGSLRSRLVERHARNAALLG